jgi:Fe2+ transport system protein FeoA
VWLCHLSAENNLPDKAHDEVAAKLRENGIVPGEDVNIHVLMRKKVSGPWILK